MKNAKLPEKTIKRSTAASLLGVGTRTLRRYEIAGLLTPVKPNSRLVLYPLAQVERIQRGEAQTAKDQPPKPPVRRSAGGNFAPRPQPQEANA